MNGELIDIRGLTVGFGTREVIGGVDFSIHANEMVALVGESGCGKSTVALALLRLLPHERTAVSGEVMFEGRNLLAVPEAELNEIRGKRISIIFQDPLASLNPVWSVGEQIIETLRRHLKLSQTAARRRAIELLDLVAIPQAHRRIDDFPHQFSGGMRQRVMIAMALACGPYLLIADEPTTALDVTTQTQILQLLDRLRRELSMSVLLITHDLSIVSDWADRVMVMYAGVIIESAPVQVLFSSARHPYTRRLLGAVPSLDAYANYRNGRLPEISGIDTSTGSTRGCRFAKRCESVESECLTHRPRLVSVGVKQHLFACFEPQQFQKSEPDAAVVV
ncbi:dipeptide ABC transporter ATP-binding protein DppD [Methylovirgula ligni]|uniref:Peptide/nickel transport system ATP-binding protein n=1 Tax=Methylovirgula ligni TaxID=569860 RepID=A0A3D9YNH7_9HYPH|nr:ABC transporter ATP-binding protein [Methylovirgula ligni]QAY96620.1 dipeptide ABC transporter ATP-binding protein DppD [Methylovirgula ligni]REF84065.1 peptide/nickel transport system ATP-binding protein [Methylovirgula ligni]